MGSLCAKPKENVVEGSNMNLENGNGESTQKAKAAPEVKDTVSFCVKLGSEYQTGLSSCCRRKLENH